MINIFTTIAGATPEQPGKLEELAGIGGEIATKFGLHPNLLISQIVAFLIVCFVLKTFAFKPLLTILEQRKSRIAEGEEKLKRIEKQLAESESTSAATLEQANADAKRIIEEAKEGATAMTEQKNQEAIASAQGIIAKAHEAAKSEQEQMVAELKRDFGRLVTLTTGNVTGKVLSDEDKNRINEESLSVIQN